MFDKASSIIRDGRKLSYEYVPASLVRREGQMERLEMLFRPVFEEGRPCSAFLTGPVGTGKTVTAKRFCAEMAAYGAVSKHPVEYIIVNCRNRSTEGAAVVQLLRHFDPGCPDRGFSVSDMMRTFRSMVEKKRCAFVIVLDEVDVLVKKNGADLIYQLSRFNEDSVNVASPLSLILISQEYIFDMIDEAALSTFRRTNTIRFDRYGREELKEIVAARASEALVEGGLGEGASDLMADISAEFGDARFAIELLDRAAHIAEGSPLGVVMPEDVRAAKAMTYSVVTESKLLDLDINHRRTLLAIARSIKNQPYVRTGAAEKTYSIVCEEYGVPARKHTQFWTYVQDLERANLIQTVVRGDGCDDASGGRTTFISLPDIPSKTLASKIEYMMDEGL
jgi:archaeal cell division control protein 6